MFTKIKNLFGNQPLPPHPASLLSSQHPHPDLKGDAAQCPFMSKQDKKEESTQKCPVTGKAVNAEVDSDSEEEKPKGGCPFMGGTSDKKKNPNLNLRQEGFDEPFVSKFKFYLSTSKLDFTNVKRGLPRPSDNNREIFDKYPIYLQHTLFFNGEDYKKVRSLECCSRFMAYEQLREKGNKRFNKGKFNEALDYYERAFSLFKWLQHCQPVNESTQSSENLSAEPAQLSNDELSENGSRVNIPLEEEGANDNPGAAFEELKSKYKQFFITYNDENTKLFEGEEMTEEADIDMRKSLLVQIYLNMAAVYINLHHYSLAEKVCDQGLALTDKVSQLYFRKAQAIALRKDASVDQLKKAKEYISTAVGNRSGQKIFSTANQNILKMLNIHNSKEAYEECQQLVNQKLNQVEQKNVKAYSMLYNRMKQIHQNQQRIISEGKVPQENMNSKGLRDTTEMKILSRMTEKYVKVIQFYTEAKNQEQVGLAKKEFQEILRINAQINNIFDIILQENEEELGGITSQKVQKRIINVKSYMAEQVYNSGKFNFTMLEWAIKEIIKEERAEEEERKKKEKLQKQAQGVIEKKGYGRYALVLILLPILFILFNMFVL